MMKDTRDDLQRASTQAETSATQVNGQTIHEQIPKSPKSPAAKFGARHPRCQSGLHPSSDAAEGDHLPGDIVAGRLNKEVDLVGHILESTKTMNRQALDDLVDLLLRHAADQIRLNGRRRDHICRDAKAATSRARICVKVTTAF